MVGQRMYMSVLFAERSVEFLNRVLQKDVCVANDIVFGSRIPCNGLLASDSEIYATSSLGICSVGFLDILNGILSPCEGVPAMIKPVVNCRCQIHGIIGIATPGAVCPREGCDVILEPCEVLRFEVNHPRN